MDERIHEIVVFIKKYYAEILLFILLFGGLITVNDGGLEWFYAAYVVMFIDYLRKSVIQLRGNEFVTTKWIFIFRMIVLLSYTLVMLIWFSNFNDALQLSLTRDHIPGLVLIAVIGSALESFLSSKRFKRNKEADS